MYHHDLHPFVVGLTITFKVQARTMNCGQAPPGRQTGLRTAAIEASPGALATNRCWTKPVAVRSRTPDGASTSGLVLAIPHCCAAVSIRGRVTSTVSPTEGKTSALESGAALAACGPLERSPCWRLPGQPESSWPATATCTHRGTGAGLAGAELFAPAEWETDGARFAACKGAECVEPTIPVPKMRATDPAITSVTAEVRVPRRTLRPRIRRSDSTAACEGAVEGSQEPAASERASRRSGSKNGSCPLICRVLLIASTPMTAGR